MFCLCRVGVYLLARQLRRAWSVLRVYDGHEVCVMPWILSSLLTVACWGAAGSSWPTHTTILPEPSSSIRDYSDPTVSIGLQRITGSEEVSYRHYNQSRQSLLIILISLVINRGVNVMTHRWVGWAPVLLHLETNTDGNRIIGLAE